MNISHAQQGHPEDLRRKFRKAERAAKIEMEVVSEIAPFVDESTRCIWPSTSGRH